jgi:ketosteroid isomerase-like protein
VPDEDTERVRRSFEAINQRDFEALIALTDPEVIAIPRLLTVEGGVLRGHAGVRTWWESILAAFPDFEATVIDVSAVGSATVCNVLFRGRGAESDAPFLDAVWVVTRWRAGKAVWWKSFLDRAEALRAVSDVQPRGDG